MASGTPVLGIVPPDTDLCALIEQEQLGFSVRPGALDEIEATILRCADGQLDVDDMGVRARTLAETRFDRRQGVAGFRNVLDFFLALKSGSKREADEPAKHPDWMVTTT